jgi:hypothetical protein
MSHLRLALWPGNLPIRPPSFIISARKNAEDQQVQDAALTQPAYAERESREYKVNNAACSLSFFEFNQQNTTTAASRTRSAMSHTHPCLQSANHVSSGNAATDVDGRRQTLWFSTCYTKPQATAVHFMLHDTTLWIGRIQGGEGTKTGVHDVHAQIRVTCRE